MTVRGWERGLQPWSPRSEQFFDADPGEGERFEIPDGLGHQLGVDVTDQRVRVHGVVPSGGGPSDVPADVLGKVVLDLGLIEFTLRGSSRFEFDERLRKPLIGEFRKRNLKLRDDGSIRGLVNAKGFRIEPDERTTREGVVPVDLVSTESSRKIGLRTIVYPGGKVQRARFKAIDHADLTNVPQARIAGEVRSLLFASRAAEALDVDWGDLRQLTALGTLQGLFRSLTDRHIRQRTRLEVWPVRPDGTIPTKVEQVRAAKEVALFRRVGDGEDRFKLLSALVEPDDQTLVVRRLTYDATPTTSEYGRLLVGLKRLAGATDRAEGVRLTQRAVLSEPAFRATAAEYGISDDTSMVLPPISSAILLDEAHPLDPNADLDRGGASF
jgi:hypothetical protein